MLSGVPVADDGAPGVGLSGVVACIGEGEESGMSVALLGGVAEAPSATPGV